MSRMERKRRNTVLINARGPLAIAGAALFHAFVLLFAVLYEPTPQRQKKIRPPYYTPPISVEIREKPVPPPPAERPADDEQPSQMAEADVVEWLPPLPTLRPEREVDEVIASVPFGQESGLPPPEGGSSRPASESIGAERSAAPRVVDVFDPEAVRRSVDRWKAARVSNTVVGKGQEEGHGGTGADQGHGGGEGDGYGPEHDVRRIAGRINAELAHAAAKSRVQAGLVDPYFRSIGDAMEREWSPRSSAVSGADETTPTGVLQNLFTNWQSAGRTWAATGSAFANAPAQWSQPVRPVERDASGLSDFAQHEFLMRWNDGDFSLFSGLVLLQLTQSPSGEPLDVTVVSSSGNSQLDASAVQAITRAAHGRMAPGSGFGLGGTRIRTIWRMEALLLPRDRTLSFDDATSPETAGATAGKGPLVKTRVELVAIYGGQTTPLVSPTE